MIQFSMERKRKKHEETGRPWYDTKQGVADSLKSLPAFLELISVRRTAGYDRGERLNEFYVLGWYWLDTCGNCCKAIDRIPKKAFPNIPDVLTRDEFWAYRKVNAKGDPTGFSFSMADDLPLKNTICPVCGKGWTIQNCHDIIMWEKTEVLLLAGFGFVGETLHAVKQHYAQLTSAVYFMQSDILIRNDRFIDLSPEYPNPEHEWQKNLVKNQRGWVSEEDGITDSYIIQPGDEGYFNVWSYYHRNCNRKHLAKTETQRFKETFEKAGFKDVHITKIRNEYCSCERCAPWLLVNTGLGIFKIGWRKRVINIDWNGLKLNLISLFKNEDVTKGPTYIHAWGWKKAEEYLKKIHDYLVSKIT